ncbi:hypothetical protein F5J12DRAFT_786493 [Pisolithus orientalis]|uniref:uncharacterized protein n=1 Tax=Pisolithus orientalis TaxID=936130 RepID=UPI0022242123|nr:uncharacterized protein F5J12DRAFT_786493 [Pisolithus orientalis]KAI5990555.1 hypothetical protein F5J12DRAFT_786493 [Pisolithus orientalis]
MEVTALHKQQTSIYQGQICGHIKYKQIQNRNLSSTNKTQAKSNDNNNIPVGNYRESCNDCAPPRPTGISTGTDVAAAINLSHAQPTAAHRWSMEMTRVPHTLASCHIPLTMDDDGQTLIAFPNGIADDHEYGVDDQVIIYSAFPSSNQALIDMTSHCMLIIPNIGMVGLNLACANIMVIVDTMWSALDDEQPHGRMVPPAKASPCIPAHHLSTPDVFLNNTPFDKGQLHSMFMGCMDEINNNNDNAPLRPISHVNPKPKPHPSLPLTEKGNGPMHHNTGSLDNPLGMEDVQPSGSKEMSDKCAPLLEPSGQNNPNEDKALALKNLQLPMLSPLTPPLPSVPDDAAQLGQVFAMPHIATHWQQTRMGVVAPNPPPCAEGALEVAKVAEVAVRLGHLLLCCCTHMHDWHGEWTSQLSTPANFM